MRDSDIDTLSADGAQDTQRMQHAELRRLAEQIAGTKAELDALEVWSHRETAQRILALLDRLERLSLRRDSESTARLIAERRVAALEEGLRYINEVNSALPRTNENDAATVNYVRAKARALLAGSGADSGGER